LYLSKAQQTQSFGKDKSKCKKKSKVKIKTPRPESEYKCCECGCTKYLQVHHVFNKDARNFSSEYDCVEWICWKHHQSSEGIHGTHSDGKLGLRLKKKHQRRLELEGMTRKEFIYHVGRSYL